MPIFHFFLRFVLHTYIHTYFYNDFITSRAISRYIYRNDSATFYIISTCNNSSNNIFCVFNVVYEYTRVQKKF